MPVKRPKNEWADPNREGRSKGRLGERFCSKCGNKVQQVRILKSLNLCEYCIRELEEKRDGINSCRGCGKVSPVEIQAHHGYCSQCICGACGQPDPKHVPKTGLCFQCAAQIGDFCRICGKEASSQVRKNKGICDDCVKAGNRPKATGSNSSARSKMKGNHSGNRQQTTGSNSAARVLPDHSFGRPRKRNFTENNTVVVKRNKPVIEKKKPVRKENRFTNK